MAAPMEERTQFEPSGDHIEGGMGQAEVFDPRLRLP